MTIRFTIYLIILLIGVLIGTAKSKTLAVPMRLLTVLLIITFSSEVISRILAYRINNSSPIYHFLLPIQYLLLARIYTILLNKQSIAQFQTISILLLIIFSIINTIFIQTIFVLPTNALVVESVLILIQVCLLFNKILDQANTVPLLKRSDFWFNCGNLFFNSGTFLFWIFHNYFLKQNTLISELYFVLWLLNIIMYICFIKALLLERIHIKPNE